MEYMFGIRVRFWELEVEIWFVKCRWMQLVVRGPAVAYPSTFETLVSGIAYSLEVGLSTQVSTGKVTLTTPRQICTDAAGNAYERSANSTIVVRFSMFSSYLTLEINHPWLLL